MPVARKVAVVAARRIECRFSRVGQFLRVVSDIAVEFVEEGGTPRVGRLPTTGMGRASLLRCLHF